MGKKISLCGKGGSGKSTLTALLARAAEAGDYSVLVVDSDESNSSLYKTLGFDSPPSALMELVGGKQTIKGKMGRQNIFHENHIDVSDIPKQYIVKRGSIHLVSIGKIHRGLEGCACPMGVLSREFLKKLKLGEKEIAVIDMEAGVEHFGRGIDTEIDAILLVVEPSFESVSIASKIKKMSDGLQKHVFAVLNKVRDDHMEKELTDILNERGIAVAGAIAEDQTIFNAGLKGTSIGSCNASRTVGKLLEQLMKD